MVNDDTAAANAIIARLLDGYTHEALSAAFDSVKPATHWKDPIDAVVPRTADLNLIAKAVAFFTATEATFKQVPEGWRVMADGYRWGPAGDH